VVWGKGVETGKPRAAEKGTKLFLAELEVWKFAGEVQGDKTKRKKKKEKSLKIVTPKR